MISGHEARRLLRQHMALECIGVNAEGRLMRIECADPDDIARFYVVQYPDGETERFYRDDLPDKLVKQLKKVIDLGAFIEPKTVGGLLRPHGEVEQIFFGKSYVFPEGLPSDADIQRIDMEGRPTFALLIDGQVVSYCQSSREDEQSAEAWVFTEPAHRGKGYAARVTAAWAADVRDRGKTAFYSHVVENKASERVAKSLGLVQYILDIGYF